MRVASGDPRDARCKAKYLYRGVTAVREAGIAIAKLTGAIVSPAREVAVYQSTGMQGISARGQRLDPGAEAAD